MSQWVIRLATRDDVPAMVAMLADDPLGAGREDPADTGTYDAAYERVAADPGQRLVVAERNGAVVGTLQRASSQGCRIAAPPARSSKPSGSRPVSAATGSAPSSSGGLWRSRAAPGARSCS